MRTNKKDQKAKREEKSYYPVAFRWKLIQELAAELLTERQACEKYGITLILIRKWRKQYYQRKIQPLLTTQPMKRKQNQSDRLAAEEIKTLKTKLLALEKQNKQLRLEAYAHKTMVDIAEKELNISIRKKSGPGQ
ncbi:MAG: hypothetical protein WA960_20700 [Tunicatimonas sp.]